MPRTTTRTLHDIHCRGCGVVFQNHNRSRAYCSYDCWLLFTSAKLGWCYGCGVKEHRGIAVWTSLETKLAYEQAEREFATAHQHCRRARLDEDERPLTCNCKTCREDIGLPPIPRASPKPSATKRSSGYRKHTTEVHQRDKFICQICDLPTLPDVHPSDDMYPTLDHEEQVRYGGSDDLNNLRTAHFWCNVMREGNPWWSDDATIGEAARLRFADRLKEPKDRGR